MIPASLCVSIVASLVVASPTCSAAQSPSPTAAVASDDRWSDAALGAYVDATRAATLARCNAEGISLPADFLAWIDADPTRRLSVFGCRADPLPVLLALRSLEIDLGEDVVRRDYPDLAIAFAMQDSYAQRTSAGTPWNDADGAKPAKRLPSVQPRDPLALAIPGDPRVPVNTKDTSRTLDRDDHIINFLEDHAPIEVEVPTKELPPLEYDERGVAKPRGKAVTVMKKVQRGVVAADVIASRELQQEFNAYMAAHGHPDVTIDCGDRAVHWFGVDEVKDQELRRRIKAAHDLFYAAYQAKGRMPKERDAAPTASESMAWFIRNDRERLSASVDGAPREHAWPMFPLTAPWPILIMLAADDQPLREREEIWLRLRDHDEFRTYGEYTGGIAQQFDMQSARRLSPFAFDYGSIQMMWKDGGVCGTMGNIGARTYRIAGVPASTAGQPGHCAIVLMERDPKTGDFRCVGGQYATGGDEVTTVHAGWNYDDVGGRRPMVYHQSVAWAVNDDPASFVEALVLRRMWDRLPAEEKTAAAEAYLKASLERTPFAIAAIDAAAAAAPDWRAAIALADTAEAAFGNAEIPALYRSTARDRFHARALAVAAPTTPDEARELATALERQSCDNAKLLARTWLAIGGNDELVARSRAAVEAYLAEPARAMGTGQPARRAAQDFAAFLKELASAITDKAARRAWAETLLPLFEGRDSLTKRNGDAQPDPAVEALKRTLEQ
ncbi:MAG: hypothetical protein JNM94_05825 [Phycisphaerae bacterium]|nr:hypothetical protein [Phycisphaerae bacterium]